MSSTESVQDNPKGGTAIHDDKFEDVAHIESHHSGTVVNRNRNVSAKIQNPLTGVDRAQLYKLADEFCDTHGFQDKQDLFHRAAVLAQNPNDYESLSELTEDDKYWVRREYTNKWSQTRSLYFLVIVCSIGSAVQGWDNTGANGSNLSFPKEFGIEDNTWLVGLVNAAPSLIVGTISAPLCDPVNHYLGRRGAVFITGLFCVFPVLGQAFTRNWWELFICRCLIGLGMGVKITTIPIYTAETAPPSIRGALVMSFQLWVAFGIFFGFCSNLIFYRIGAIAWRVQLAAAFVPAIPVLLMCWFAPESPRWLMKKGRYQKAFASFCRLRFSEIQAARDMFYAHCQILEEMKAHQGTTYFTRLRDIFTKPRLRRANLASWTVMIGQQLCGINIMAFYSSTIFAEAGYNIRDSLLASFGFGLINTIFALPAIWTIDTFGRRNLLLLGFPLMALSLLWAGSMFFMDPANSARVPVLAVAIYLFTIAYSPTMGPCPFVYAAECYPLTHREIGMSFAVQQNNFWSSVLGLTFPSLLRALQPWGAFYFYAGTNILGLILIFFFMPETAQRTLEELDFVFAVPVGVFAKYQLSTWLPWWIKRYVLFRRDAKLEPLYHLEGVAGEGTRPERAH
ncbi:hexose transport-related protein [Kockovaella imperatae]|uniref:Hexose transport-related protein n=1 Tax=Kockovaella imperatae TaxID=4999 RepID=A0A1Y1U707_9TREE|nr:hexose transport-related protein [Kockovaella imperatae]ORX33819.1 hexose transport-related protein [Kockovaella imperatae]